MELDTDVLFSVREQVLRIAAAAREVCGAAGSTDPGLSARLEEIVERADRCRQLIDGQVPPTGQQEQAALRTTAVGPAVEEAIRIVERRGLCRTPIRFVSDGDPTAVVTRETLLRILTGLLADACQHALHGTPVDVAARHDVVEAHIEVTHRGNGADSDRLDAMLVSGEDGAPGDAYAPGIALNLRMVRALVEAHSGYLEVETEGDAVTVVVCLPSPVPSRLTPRVVDLTERVERRRPDPEA